MLSQLSKKITECCLAEDFGPSLENSREWCPHESEKPWIGLALPPFQKWIYDIRDELRCWSNGKGPCSAPGSRFFRGDMTGAFQIVENGFRQAPLGEFHSIGRHSEPGDFIRALRIVRSCIGQGTQESALFWGKASQNFELIGIKPEDLLNLMKIDLPTTPDKDASPGEPESHHIRMFPE